MEAHQFQSPNRNWEWLQPASVCTGPPPIASAQQPEWSFGNRNQIVSLPWLKKKKNVQGLLIALNKIIRAPYCGPWCPTWSSPPVSLWMPRFPASFGFQPLFPPFFLLKQPHASISESLYLHCFEYIFPSGFLQTGQISPEIIRELWDS